MNAKFVAAILSKGQQDKNRSLVFSYINKKNSIIARIDVIKNVNNFFIINYICIAFNKH